MNRDAGLSRHEYRPMGGGAPQLRPPCAQPYAEPRPRRTSGRATCSPLAPRAWLINPARLAVRSPENTLFLNPLNRQSFSSPFSFTDRSTRTATRTDYEGTRSLAPCPAPCPEGSGARAATEALAVASQGAPASAQSKGSVYLENQEPIRPAIPIPHTTRPATSPTEWKPPYRRPVATWRTGLRSRLCFHSLRNPGSSLQSWC